MIKAASTMFAATALAVGGCGGDGPTYTGTKAYQKGWDIVMRADDGVADRFFLTGACWDYEATHLTHYSPEQHAAFSEGCKDGANAVLARR